MTTCWANSGKWIGPPERCNSMALMRMIVSTRFDRFSYTSRFTVRMPIFTHDVFIELVV